MILKHSPSRHPRDLLPVSMWYILNTVVFKIWCRNQWQVSVCVLPADTITPTRTCIQDPFISSTWNTTTIPLCRAVWWAGKASPSSTSKRPVGQTLEARSTCVPMKDIPRGGALLAHSHAQHTSRHIHVWITTARENSSSFDLHFFKE